MGRKRSYKPILSYGEAWALLEPILDATGRNARSRRLYAALLLIVLRNGCQAGEAYRAARLFLETGRRLVHVKRSFGPGERPVVIPGAVTEWHLKPLLERPEYKVLAGLENWAVRRLGLNTRSLVCAFIARMSELGVPANVIARLTGVQSFATLVKCTSDGAAERALLKVV